MATQASARAASVTLVITTFNRAGYLEGLLRSVALLDPAPGAVVVVDNASTDSTQELVSRTEAEFPVPLYNLRLPDNVGGSGGFSAGVQYALDHRAEWLWLMDDDVEVLPSALASLAPWMERYQCIHGRRWDRNGAPFFWQHTLSEFFGVHFPVKGNVFKDGSVFHTNVGCFEGMLVQASVVRAVGLPDPRFFLNGDDTTYGWLISQSYPVAYVDEFVLRKARPQKQIDLGIRHLNDSSDLARFCGMRNRGHLGQYLRSRGRYHPVGFALGTLLTVAKEVLRLVAVEHSLQGLGALWRGWREARTILADRRWQPMPPLPEPDPAPGPPTAGGA